MRPLIFTALFLFMGCSSGLVYKTAPADKLSPARTARLTGEVRPWGLYFTAIAQVDGGAVRLIVLSEIGFKLLDINVTPEETAVYYKFKTLPAAAAAAFGRFARKTLLQPCPPKNLSFTDPHTRAVFEASVQGAKICL